jgi:hypothetical protein
MPNAKKSKYVWPASLIDEKVMVRLYHEKQKQGKPITAIIRDALIEYLKKRP